MPTDDLWIQRASRGGGRKKLIEVAEWRVEYQPRCAACKDLYARRSPTQEPPCDSCRPVILEENEEAISLYSFVQNQWIMGPVGPIDINHVAVWEAIDRYIIKDKIGTFKKILILSQWMIGRINNKKD